MSMRWGGIVLLVAASLWACGGSASEDVREPSRSVEPVPVEPVEIDVDAERAGTSMVVTVVGVGRGFRSGTRLESPEAWQVAASAGGTALRKVLAGPAEVRRDPAGSAFGDQWDVSVRFTVAFAVPPHIERVRVAVTAPDGERLEREIKLETAFRVEASLSGAEIVVEGKER